MEEGVIMATTSIVKQLFDVANRWNSIIDLGFEYLGIMKCARY